MHELAKKTVGTSRAIVRKIVKAAPAAVIQQMPDLAQLHRDIRRWKQDSGRSRQNPQSIRSNRNPQALPFCRLAYIVSTYEYISEVFMRKVFCVAYVARFLEQFGQEHDIEGWISYFDRTWIGPLCRTGVRRPPRFSHELWNCYDNALADIPHTNNHIESWHKQFNEAVANGSQRSVRSLISIGLCISPN